MHARSIRLHFLFSMPENAGFTAHRLAIFCSKLRKIICSKEKEEKMAKLGNSAKLAEYTETGLYKQ